MAISVRRKPARIAASSAKAASDTIGVLSPGCRIVGVCKGQFSMLDLIDATLDQVGPASVTVSTWTQGKAEMSRVESLLRSGRVTSFRLLIDRSFVKLHPEYVRFIQRMAGPDALRQTKTHAKFALIAAGDWRIVIRGSMNFNRNPRLEQFDIDDDPAIYEFFQGVVDTVFRAVPAGVDIGDDEISAGFHSVLGDDDDAGGMSWADMSWDDSVWTEIEEA